MTATTSGTSTNPRLQRGSIPPTWAQPAEAVSSIPTPVARPLPALLIVGTGIATCIGLAIAFAPSVPARVPASAPESVRAVLPAQPQPIEAVAEPPRTSSSSPTGVAPEDQGGQERPLDPPPAPVSAPVPASVPTPTPAAAPIADHLTPPVVTELPARKKTKELVERADKLLIAKDAVAAEKLLKRAAALDPTYADAWRGLGIARATLGDAAGARIAYRKYLALAPEAADAAEVKAILAR